MGGFLYASERYPMEIQTLRIMVIECTSCTAMANAFRRALGVPAIWVRPKHTRPLVVSRGTYDEMIQCFENYGSPMDGKFDE